MMTLKSIPNLNFSAIASEGENEEEAEAMLTAGAEKRQPKEDWGP